MQRGISSLCLFFSERNKGTSFKLRFFSTKRRQHGILTSIYLLIRRAHESSTPVFYLQRQKAQHCNFCFHLWCFYITVDYATVHHKMALLHTSLHNKTKNIRKIKNKNMRLFTLISVVKQNHCMTHLLSYASTFICCSAAVAKPTVI